MKRLNLWAIIRLCLAFALIALFLIIPLSAIENGNFCLYHRITGKLCPGCGITRGMWQIVRFNFSKAFALNPVFTLCFYPLFILSVINDLYCLIYRLITKKEKLSVIEYYLSGKFTEAEK